MSQLAHVIHPNGRTRWERSFRDGVPPESILSELRRFDSKVQIGFVGTQLKTDSVTDRLVPHPDRATGYVVDHPDTRIVLGRADGDEFVEERTLSGPERAPAEATRNTPEDY